MLQRPPLARASRASTDKLADIISDRMCYHNFRTIISVPESPGSRPAKSQQYRGILTTPAEVLHPTFAKAPNASLRDTSMRTGCSTTPDESLASPLGQPPDPCRVLSKSVGISRIPIFTISGSEMRRPTPMAMERCWSQFQRRSLSMFCMRMGLSTGRRAR